ncbi:MAG: hypothetical protein ABI867_14635, partial [Kofleriaceae bacterium]
MSSILWLAASSASADTATLSVVVRGSVDAAALRTSVARELETQVVLAATCTAPCLEISVSAGKASVAFTPRDGGSRARIVTLGDDRTQWPTIITLLAGNVVRDEAADVLAGLPEIGPQPVTSGVPA